MSEENNHIVKKQKTVSISIRNVLNEKSPKLDKKQRETQHIGHTIFSAKQFCVKKSV